MDSLLFLKIQEETSPEKSVSKKNFSLSDIVKKVIKKEDKKPDKELWKKH